jgi:stromal membrane-associated protein
MSRRAPNPAAEKAAQNQATLKSLLKLEANKVCADCKRNKRTCFLEANERVHIVLT